MINPNAESDLERDRTPEREPLQECVNCGRLSRDRWCSRQCWEQEDNAGHPAGPELDEDYDLDEPEPEDEEPEDELP